MKTYTIIGGIAGVGKSSLLGVLKAQRTDLGMMIADQNIPALKLRKWMEQGIPLTQEMPVFEKTAEEIVKEALKREYRIRLFYVALDTAEESMERIQKRLRYGGLNVAAEKVLCQFSSRWEMLMRILPYCDEVECYDNTNGFLLCADYKSRILRWVGTVQPKWLTEFMRFYHDQIPDKRFCL